jgi:hypothetical protein
VLHFTRKEYQLPSEIHDLHRIAHIQHHELPGLADRSRLQHQCHGLGDAHEVTGYIRMRNRNRPAICDLFQEYRNHAAFRPQHITEPYGHDVRLCHRRMS